MNNSYLFEKETPSKPHSNVGSPHPCSLGGVYAFHPGRPWGWQAVRALVAVIHLQ